MALCSIKPRVKVKKEKRKKGEQNTHWFGYICWRDKKTDRPTDIDRSKDRYMDRQKTRQIKIKMDRYREKDIGKKRHRYR